MSPTGELLAARRLDQARALLEQPTAPLLEAAPLAHLERVCTTLPGVTLATDDAGNLAASYCGRDADPSRPLVLVAHLDHPGFAIDRVEGREVHLEFRGGLSAEHATPGSPLELFTADGAPTGTATLTEADADRDRGRLVGAGTRLDEGSAAVGGFAMWGFPGWVLDGDRIVSRCCDDLLGAAAGLCALAETAEAAPAASALTVLFTRAEEVGFLGALEAIRLGTVPRDAVVLSLECSKALPDAPQGGGVIVRVGDRMSIFDPPLTEALRQAASRAEQSARDAGTPFAFQRKLMDGGACEATAFCAAGWRASGLALPLGNYHNGAFAPDGSPTVGPESVVVADFHAEIDLLVTLATTPGLLDEASGPPPWFTERAEHARRSLS